MSTPQTLIVIHGSRYIEVFTSDSHQVRILQVPFMESAAGEILIEEHILQSLPPNWQETYCEFNLSDRDSIRDISVVDVAIKQTDIALHQVLNRHIGSGAESATVTI